MYNLHWCTVHVKMKVPRTITAYDSLAGYATQVDHPNFHQEACEYIRDAVADFYAHTCGDDKSSGQEF